MPKETLICNGRIVAETHYLPKGYVFIKNGKIASIGEDWSSITAEEVFDVQGRIVSPGFIDMHTHGIKDVDFMESDSENMVRGLSEYARFGVIHVVGSTLSNPLEQIIHQAKRMRIAKENRDYGDILLGVHIEGPWLVPSQRGGHALQYLRIPEKDDVNRLLGEVGDVIRTVTFSPELPNAVWLAEQLSFHGIVGVLGHTEASYEETERVILAGVRHVTHLYDATYGFKENPNEALVMMPGLETAVVMCDEVSVELIGCPVHVPKPFFQYINKVKPRNKKVIVTDSLVGTGMPDGTILTYRDGRKVYVSEGVLRMIDDDPKIHGNLTGSAVTMNVALRRLKEYANLSIPEAIRWGSINPATTLGIDKETGSIRVGKYADLTIIDDDFNVKMTFLKGRMIYNT
ncbi:MAG: N-acetylglucosamine-6-phosphate deacetylase [Candidatus Atribacteria bacterium]|nr:N-acetylglucosamine-6-phosphate deacetylase [Candidatus Atribacteria bacterium]